MNLIKIITSLLPLFLLGCQSDEVSLLSDRNSTHAMVQKQEQNLTQNVTSEEESFLNALGVSYKDDKLIIDLNKTDQFFVALEKRADAKAKALEKELEEINISKEAGIFVDERSLSIDLNKTKNLLEELSHLFENVLFDVNRTNY